MKRKLKLAIPFLGFLLVAAAPPAHHFDSNQAWEHLRQIVAIGPRPSGSPAIEQTRKYIKDQLAAYAIPVVEQRWVDDTPIGKIPMANLIATIRGKRKERIILGGHYDTKRAQFRFVGASDGGSSAALLIEMARVLKSRKNAFTIDLVFFDGEEAVNWEWAGTDNTYGSRHYVEVARRDGSLATVKAMVLVDMIGDRDLDVRRDTNSTRWLNDIVWSAAHRLKLDSYFVPQDTTIGGDDHFPFVQAGVPAIDIIDLDYEQWHRAGDTLDAVSARSLQVVGDVVLAALPQIEKRLSSKR